MANQNKKRIQPGTFTLALGVILFLFGIFTLVSTGSAVVLTLGIFIFGMGFVGYIFNNDVFDITLGVVTALGVMFFGLYQFQTHFMAHDQAAIKHSEK